MDDLEVPLFLENQHVGKYAILGSHEGNTKGRKHCYNIRMLPNPRYIPSVAKKTNSPNQNPNADLFFYRKRRSHFLLGHWWRCTVERSVDSYQSWARWSYLRSLLPRKHQRIAGAGWLGSLLVGGLLFILSWFSGKLKETHVKTHFFSNTRQSLSRHAKSLILMNQK